MRPALLIAALVITLAPGRAISGPAPKAVSPRVTKAQAIEIARHTAIGDGIALSQYRLDDSPNIADHDQDGWWINFRCHPQPTPPGCGFFVHVDWSTGKPLLLKGQ